MFVTVRALDITDAMFITQFATLHTMFSHVQLLHIVARPSFSTMLYRGITIVRKVTVHACSKCLLLCSIARTYLKVIF